MVIFGGIIFLPIHYLASTYIVIRRDPAFNEAGFLLFCVAKIHGAIYTLHPGRCPTGPTNINLSI